MISYIPSCMILTNPGLSSGNINITIIYEVTSWNTVIPSLINVCNNLSNFSQNFRAYILRDSMCQRLSLFIDFFRKSCSHNKNSYRYKYRSENIFKNMIINFKHITIIYKHHFIFEFFWWRNNDRSKWEPLK